MAHEALLWSWMHEHAVPVPGLDLRRVENLLARGTPDVEGCWWGDCFQVELKGENRPKRNTTPIHFPMRIEQHLWLARRWRCGGSAWVYCRVGTGRSTSRYLIPGHRAGELMEPRCEWWLVNATVLPPAHAFTDFLRVVCTLRSRAHIVV